MNRIGRYTVLRRLVAGDIAEVLACGVDDTQVAVKLFRPKSGAIERISKRTPDATIERLRQRFRDEAALMAKFDHPNIVPVLEIGALDPETPYYVMPYFPSSLASEVWQTPPPRRDPTVPLPAAAPQMLAPDVALERLRDILSGLAAIHERGIVHRDLKPRNTLVDSDGRAAVSDFGVAKVPWPGYEPLRPAFGTPPFVSPEQQTKSASVDARSDVYSVGAIAYFILTGRFPRENMPPHRIDPRIDASLSEWIMLALNPDPSARPADAAAMLRRLDDVTPDPTLAR